VNLICYELVRCTYIYIRFYYFKINKSLLSILEFIKRERLKMDENKMESLMSFLLSIFIQFNILLLSLLNFSCEYNEH